MVQQLPLSRFVLPLLGSRCKKIIYSLINMLCPIKKKYLRGFTLVELLVTISIIALLAMGAMLVFQYQTKKSRDVKRLADLRQLQTGLNLYHAGPGLYPDSGVGAIYLGSALNMSDAYVCLSDGGFFKLACGLTDKIFIESLPADPLASQYYLYQSTFETNESYYIDFIMEVGTDNVANGENCITPDGIMDGSCDSNFPAEEE